MTNDQLCTIDLKTLDGVIGGAGSSDPSGRVNTPGEFQTMGSAVGGALGLRAGAVVGSAAGPVGTAVGAGLGWAGGRAVGGAIGRAFDGGGPAPTGGVNGSNSPEQMAP